MTLLLCTVSSLHLEATWCTVSHHIHHCLLLNHGGLPRGPAAAQSSRPLLKWGQSSTLPLTQHRALLGHRLPGRDGRLPRATAAASRLHLMRATPNTIPRPRHHQLPSHWGTTSVPAFTQS